MKKITLTREQLDDIMYRTEGFDPSVEFSPTYSGRGMYGAKCVGVIADSASTPAAFLYILADELDMEFLDLLGDLGFGARDSMGLSTIYYWSHLTLDDEAIKALEEE